MNPLLMEKLARARQQDLLREAGMDRRSKPLPPAPRPDLTKVLAKALEELLLALNSPREIPESPRVMQAGD